MLVFDEKYAILGFEKTRKGENMIRKVQEHEIPSLYPFVYRILSDMQLPILDEIDSETFKKIVIEAMHSPHYRYGYEHAYVNVRDGQIAGVLFGYPGQLEALIDGPLRAAMLNHGYSMEYSLTEPETLPGQWYIDTLVTHPDYRRQGVALELMKYAEEVAQEAGFDSISLNCDMSNEAGYSLYFKSGYLTKTRIVLAGHVYWHMVKNISKN